jgi:hypothetical protein
VYIYMGKWAGLVAKNSLAWGKISLTRMTRQDEISKTPPQVIFNNLSKQCQNNKISLCGTARLPYKQPLRTGRRPHANYMPFWLYKISSHLSTHGPIYKLVSMCRIKKKKCLYSLGKYHFNIIIIYLIDYFLLNQLKK